jgi:polyisoprenoid-binding protein YceI
MIPRTLAPALIVFGILAPGPAPAAKWVMRPAESMIALEVTYLGSPVAARFGKFSAEIEFEPSDLAHSAVSVRIDTGSFDSQSVDRDEFVKERDWFDVARFPEARFVTKSIRSVAPGHYEATADLTIRGITKEVELPFALVIEGGVARMDGGLSLERGDYGVGQGDWASTKEVGGRVGVSVRVVADRAR